MEKRSRLQFMLLSKAKFLVKLTHTQTS
jgi:hypothetical protein